MALQKTRSIPISELYSMLQLEYFSYKLRSLLYQREFDKKKFQDISEKKKKKIQRIALGNCLGSIFTSETVQQKYLKEFFGEIGLPRFCYRDDYQTRVKGYWDAFYYYVVGSSVRYIDEEDEIKIGIIKECDINKRLIKIESDGEMVTRDFTQVSRIFSSDFYEKFLCS